MRRENLNGEFDEYLKAGEPSQREKAYVWATAIGLQQVDQLTPSEYLIQTARRNIEGEITLAESRELMASYYKSQPKRDEDVNRIREADLVSQHIAEILAEPTFSLSPSSYVAIHKRIFAGVFSHAGRLRDYNITKNEWVLKKDSVRYESAEVVAETLEYEINRERKFDYRGLSVEEIIAHISQFTADIWQVHAFGEGNTRTTAVFIIKYLRKLGYDVTNDVFAAKARYFRDALVRANYSNQPKGVHPTLAYLERFFSNLLMGTKYELKSRFLLVGIEEPKELLVPPKREQVREQVRDRPSKFVIKLIKAIRGEMSTLEMMVALGLTGRRNFLEKYLSPAIEGGYVEMTQPNSAHSPTQRYRLSAKGMMAKDKKEET